MVASSSSPAYFQTLSELGFLLLLIGGTVNQAIRAVQAALLVALFAFVSPHADASTELNEIIGDTVIVGWTALDNQHNTVIGRMLAYDPNGDGGNGVVHLTFTKLTTNLLSRYVVGNKVNFVDGLPIVHQIDGSTVSLGSRAGYSTIGMAVNMDNPFPVILYHDRASSADAWAGRAASESELLPGFYFEQPLPYQTGVSVTQFKVAMDGDSVAHVAGGHSLGDATGDRPLIYYRLGVNREENAFTVTNPGGVAQTITGLAPFSAAEIAVSPDGQRVAISHMIGRLQLGTVQAASGADYVLWVNEERGQNWTFDSSLINVTQFAGPYDDLLNDTLAANGDTMRVTSGSSIFFDEDNVLHFAHEVYPYFHYQNVGYIFGRVYYWNDVHMQHIQVADGSFFLNAGVTSYGAMTGKPSLYKDPDTGYLWCLYQQFGEPGDTLANGDPMDAGAGTGLLNADIYIAASPPGEYNGLLWYKGVNITNTKGTTGNIPAGECRHERDASIALNNDGDFLNILYVQDRDAGNYDNGNGSITNNPVIYHRVSKQELIDIYNERQQLVRNYPIHRDSTGFWQDELDWEWRELTAVRESQETAHLDEYELVEAWPNPFNAQLNLKVRIPFTQPIRVVAHDLLGRQAALLHDGTLRSGVSTLTFDAAGLSSGIYFIRLESRDGTLSRVQKVALIR